MQRSSNKIGALAAALAKAQSELENPLKSLTATIEAPLPCEGQRSFRYAPLSAGLDIARKCLGQNEIATVQATTIDRDTGLIRLTTTLVHASGEWISSDWPVCSASETATPRRMGAALTYARRYALFTLVGIAGEDDLDAPDLAASPGPLTHHNGSLKPEQGPVGHASRSETFSQPLPAPERQARAERPKPATLSSSASERLRRQLIAELAQLTDSETLATWATRALPLKNQLVRADAETLEAAFAACLSKLSGPTPSPAPESTEANGSQSQPQSADPSAPGVIAIAKPARERDRNHLRFVASQPCLVCGRTPSDPHHIKFAEQLAMGRKVSDRFTVPICRLHHRELHRRGNERSWWQSQGIAPLPVAATLWARTHAVTPAEANITGEEDQSAGVEARTDGRSFIDGAALVGLPQNDETKPMHRPEAG